MKRKSRGPSAREVIVIGDSEDDTLIPNSSPQRPRSRAASFSSVASSCTLREASPLILEADEASTRPAMSENPRKRPYQFTQTQLVQDKLKVSSKSRAQTILIDDDEDEGANAEEFDSLQQELLAQAARQPNFPHRNLSIINPATRLLQTVVFAASQLKPLKFVLLQDRSIFRIKQILSTNGEISLRGWIYKPVRNLGGMMDDDHNEYYLDLHIDRDDPRTYLEQSVDEIHPREIQRVVKVVITNELYPKHSNIMDLREIRKMEGYNHNYIHQNEVFCVRWKSICEYENAQVRQCVTANPDKWSHMIIGKRLERVTEPECTPSKGISCHELRFKFRGIPTVLGGSFIYQIPGTENENENRRRLLKFDPNKVPGPLPPGTSEYFDPEEHEGRKKRRKSNFQPQISSNGRTHLPHLFGKLSTSSKKLLTQFYTYGDGFCGAGGMTRGAYLAQLKIVFGFDADENACQSWITNFRLARIFKMFAHQFLSLPDPDKKVIVDIVHLSPPCQFFAPCHTVAGPNDDKNIASLFMIEQCLDKCRSRIVTMEETFGLLTHHKDFFNALVRMFTSKGFSVSWQIVKMEELGVPQARRRLIVIASCPGETLPPFIKATHALASNRASDRQPHVPPINVLTIPHPAPADHEIPPIRTKYTPWDPYKLFKTITCSGTISHFSGKRSATYFEIKKLMGFPDNHKFVGKEIRKQMGNSVPPIASNVILTQIKGFMKKEDSKVEENIWDAKKTVCWTKRVS